MSEAQVAQSSPDVAPCVWTYHEEGQNLCFRCGEIFSCGWEGEGAGPDDAGLSLCAECAHDLVTAYVASSPDMRLIRVQVVEVPLAAPPPEDISPSDISVTITWDPASDPRSVDIQVSPEPTSGAAAALDLIEGALVRGCEYLSSYRGAAADDEEVAS